MIRWMLHRTWCKKPVTGSAWGHQGGRLSLTCGCRRRFVMNLRFNRETR